MYEVDGCPVSLRIAVVCMSVVVYTKCYNSLFIFSHMTNQTELVRLFMLSLNRPIVDCEQTSQASGQYLSAFYMVRP